ncbi:hypothetical protein PSTT_16235, partial [Puccinia striiformis]
TPRHRYHPLIVGTTPLSSVTLTHRRCHPSSSRNTPSLSVPPTCRRYHPLVVGTIHSSSLSFLSPHLRPGYHIPNHQHTRDRSNP